MTRLDELRTMRAFIDREIACEISRQVDALRTDPLMMRVCNLYNVPVESVLQGRREHDITRARHAATWLLNRRGMTMRGIAQAFGYSAVSSVHKAIHRVDGDMAMKALLTGLEVAA